MYEGAGTFGDQGGPPEQHLYIHTETQSCSGGGGRVPAYACSQIDFSFSNTGKLDTAALLEQRAARSICPRLRARGHTRENGEMLSCTGGVTWRSYVFLCWNVCVRVAVCSS
jgi:hypothetical protein